MDTMPYITTATELQRNYKKVVKKAKKAKDAIFVLSNNKPEGVYMDYKTYLEKRMFKGSNLKIGDKRDLLALAGSISSKEADELNKAIDEMNERIDPDDWK